MKLLSCILFLLYSLGGIESRWFNGQELPSPQRRFYGNSSTRGSAKSHHFSGVQCTRERKAWSMLSNKERALYKEALGIAMQNGLHILFASIHSNRRTNDAAHEHCAFFAWHRRFLLAYENMLRSLGDKFKCVTIPYWNYFEEAERYINGQCSSYEECSDFLQGLGGSEGDKKTVKILGERQITANCVTTYPNNFFCETAYKKPCVGCIPRGRWMETPINASRLRFDNVEKYIIVSNGNFEVFRKETEYGFHVAIHEELGGLISINRYSAFDPAFHSHHATVDLIASMFYKCFVGDKEIPKEQRTTNPAAFLDGCRPEVNGEEYPQMTMDLLDEKGQRIAADDHPDLKQFFINLSLEYDDYLYIAGLGENSYTYTLDKFLNAKAPEGIPSTCRSKLWRKSEKRNKSFI